MPTESTAATAGRTRTGRSRPGLERNAKYLPEHGRDHNLALVLRTLYWERLISRADIARATGLSRITVSDYIAKLIEDRLVIEVGTRQAGRPGKPATLLDIDRCSKAIAVVDLSQPGRFTGAVTTLDGEVMSETLVTAPELAGEAAVASILELLDRVVGQATAPLIGIGIGSPGIIDDHGTVIESWNLGWTDVPLAATVQDRFDLPAYVVNDANAAALAERAWGHASDDLIVIHMGCGLGAGVILNGELIKGSHHAAGEFAHVIISGFDDEPDEHTAENSIESRIIGRGWPTAATTRPDERAAWQAETGRRLALALAPTIGMLDVSEIIVNGPEEIITPLLIESAAREIAARTTTRSKHQLTVRASGLGSHSVLRGATMRVLAAQLGI